MKINAIKTKVFQLVGVPGTQELKRQRPDLTQGRDLRYKTEWLTIHEILKHQQAEQLDLTLDDIDREDTELKQSLHRVGRMTGLSAQAVEKTWETIQKNAQVGSFDVTLEELEV